MEFFGVQSVDTIGRCITFRIGRVNAFMVLSLFLTMGWQNLAI